MEITYKDRGEFLRGFLVLIRKNKNVNEHERAMSLIVGKHFGFAEDFCIESIDYLLENEFISEEPPAFSNGIIAEYFVNETYRILNQIHPLGKDEIAWLARTAEVNKINHSLPGTAEN